MHRMKLAGQVVAVGLVVSLLGLLAWKVTHDDGGNPAAAFERGERPLAPSFTLDRMDADGELRLSSLRGDVVVINFWAAWCDPCRKEMPRLEQAWQRYRDRGVTFVGVNTTDFSGDAQRFLRRYKVTFPIVRDGNGRVLARYGGLPIPWTYFVGRDGRIVGYIRGEVTSAALEDGLRQALAA
jgi:cytochrome c biogenesis protein CcmG, thiol:disulfide interchange protein DsbE